MGPSHSKRSSIANFDVGEATLAERVAVGVLVEMIVFWRDHSRSLVTGLGQSEEARNLAEAVAVDLHEFKHAPAGSTLQLGRSVVRTP
jgi:hypothetical protein